MYISDLTTEYMYKNLHISFENSIFGTTSLYRDGTVKSLMESWNAHVLFGLAMPFIELEDGRNLRDYLFTFSDALWDTHEPIGAELLHIFNKDLHRSSSSTETKIFDLEHNRILGRFNFKAFKDWALDRKYGTEQENFSSYVKARLVGTKDNFEMPEQELEYFTITQLVAWLQRRALEFTETFWQYTYYYHDTPRVMSGEFTGLEITVKELESAFHNHSKLTADFVVQNSQSRTMTVRWLAASRYEQVNTVLLMRPMCLVRDILLKALNDSGVDDTAYASRVTPSRDVYKYMPSTIRENSICYLSVENTKRAKEGDTTSLAHVLHDCDKMLSYPLRFNGTIVSRYRRQYGGINMKAPLDIEVYHLLGFTPNGRYMIFDTKAGIWILDSYHYIKEALHVDKEVIREKARVLMDDKLVPRDTRNYRGMVELIEEVLKYDQEIEEKVGRYN